MRSKPVIGISGGIDISRIRGPLGDIKASVPQDYIHSVEKAGGIAVILPVTEDEESARTIMELTDGLLLTGGHDVDPGTYSEEPMPMLQETLPIRDRFESLLIEEAMKCGKPILGICRGAQILNASLGGTLHQDLSYANGSRLCHDQKTDGRFPSHSLLVNDNTILSEIMAREQKVNSFHHQSVKLTAPGFIVSAISKDGVIEGIEMEEKPFVVGIQCHPESMVDDEVWALELFRRFVTEARRVMK
jgi:putative glutamine amidotransferase